MNGPLDLMATDFVQRIWERGMRSIGWHGTADQLHAIRERRPLRA